MSEQDSRTPKQGPVPDPHADEPVPRPDSHARKAPGADTPRPDQYEDLGPVAELFGVAGMEAASRVSHDPELLNRAIERGAEVEGVETAQIFGLFLATIVALAMIVVAVAVMMTRVGVSEEERRLAELRYPELAEIRAAEEERLTTYGRVDDRFHIPLERAQSLMAEEARAARENGVDADGELPATRRGFNVLIPGPGLPGLIPVPEPIDAEDSPATVDEAPEQPEEEPSPIEDEPENDSPEATDN